MMKKVLIAFLILSIIGWIIISINYFTIKSIRESFPKGFGLGGLLREMRKGE